MRPSVAVVGSVFLAQINKAFANASNAGERMALFGTQIILTVLLHELNGAALRLDQIKELRSLLRRCARLCPEELAARLVLAAKNADGAESDIRPGALERTLDELRVAFIELHASLETSTDPQAPALLAECWTFLAQTNAKRVIVKSPW